MLSTCNVRAARLQGGLQGVLAHRSTAREPADDDDARTEEEEEEEEGGGGASTVAAIAPATHRHTSVLALESLQLRAVAASTRLPAVRQQNSTAQRRQAAECE